MHETVEHVKPLRNEEFSYCSKFLSMTRLSSFITASLATRAIIVVFTRANRTRPLLRWRLKQQKGWSSLNGNTFVMQSTLLSSLPTVSIKECKHYSLNIFESNATLCQTQIFHKAFLVRQVNIKKHHPVIIKPYEINNKMVEFENINETDTSEYKIKRKIN